MRHVAFLAFGVIVSTPVFGDVARTKTVRFATGTSAVTLPGIIQGYDTVNYTDDAAAGPDIAVTLNPDSSATCMNIFAPGTRPGDVAAACIGSTGGNLRQGTLTEDGEYVVPVYRMRSAARLDETAHHTLEIATE